MYIYTQYTHYICIYIHVYIYIYRERERERESQITDAVHVECRLGSAAQAAGGAGTTAISS